VVSVCFDEALLTTQDAAGTVNLTVKIPLPTLVVGQDCSQIKAQLLSLQDNIPVKESESLSPTFVQSVNDETICSATFAIDAGIVSEPITSTVSKTPFALVLQEPTTILCIAAPVGVGFVTTCRATVSGNAPTGTVSWSSAGQGLFSPATCTVSRFGYCQVTYKPSSGISPVPVTAKYSGDSHNTKSEGVFPLTVNVKPSRTMVSCTPRSLKLGSSAQFTCTATVIGYNPTGTISWQETGSGGIKFSQTSCNLVAKRCSVTATPIASGQITISAAYQGDPNNGSSLGSKQLHVQ
jgi:hypothetical protein